MGGAKFVWRISQGLKFPECTLVVVVTTSPCPSNFLYVGSSTGSTICFTFFFFFFCKIPSEEMLGPPSGDTCSRVVPFAMWVAQDRQCLSPSLHEAKAAGRRRPPVLLLLPIATGFLPSYPRVQFVQEGRVKALLFPLYFPALL